MKNRRLQLRVMALLAIFVGVMAVAFGISTLFAANQTNLSTVNVKVGYRQARVSWTFDSIENTTTNAFAVYRKSQSDAQAHRVAFVGSDVREVSDLALVPNETYSYAVVFMQSPDELSHIETSTLVWSAPQKITHVGRLANEETTSPHLGSGVSGSQNKTCNSCHVAHGASASSVKLLKTSQDNPEPDSRTALCQSCHMRSGTVEYTTLNGALTAHSGHTVKNQNNPSGTFVCGTCHGVHQDSRKGTGALTPKTIWKFGSLTEDIAIDPDEPAIACVGCHDDEHTWYTATHEGATYTETESYETTTNISSGLKTYPSSGTYLGKTVTRDEEKNGHALIAGQDTYQQGDCRYCHASHGNDQLDMLLGDRGELRAMKAVGGVVSEEERVSGAYASFCLSCHNGNNEGTPWENAANIADMVSVPVGSTDATRAAFAQSPAGHKVSSPLADVPSGSALPCYTCHNPHGSKHGNAYNLNDTLGSNLTGDRNTCFACHTSSDGYILSEDGTSYVTLPDDAQEIVGLSRSGLDTFEGGEHTNKLKLPDNLEAHGKDSDMACDECHGSAHGLHQPSGTDNPDGKSCLQCHNTEFVAALEYEFTSSGSPEAEGWENGYNPHLIPAFSASMGEGFIPELVLAPLGSQIIPLAPATPQAPASGPSNAPLQSTNQIGPYCVGCHAWHSAEVGTSATGKPAGRESGATLRKSYNSTDVATTDYIHTPGQPKLGGLCISCHNDYLGEFSVGAPTRGPINSLNRLDSQLFNNCFHNYTVKVERNAAAGGVSSEAPKTFDANCAKCHNDADPIMRPLENSSLLDLKVHYVPGRRLLARFGITADIAEPATGADDKETARLNYNNRGMCFGCHARSGEIAGNAGKAYVGKDWYGQRDMNSVPSTELQEQGWTYNSTTGLAQRVFRNTNGDIIGTLTMNNEATFDDMYKLSTQPSGFPSGDGEGGAADASATSALAKGVGMEVSGHQVNRPKAQWKTDRLKPYVTQNVSAIRCSECHNVHATGMGAMGTHVEWPITRKGRVGKTESAAVGGAIGLQSYNGNVIYTDNTTPDLAIATDGSRLITLNDFWSRNNLVDDVHSAMVAWLQTSAGGGYTATQAEDKYNELDYNGITPEMVAEATGTSVDTGLALQWSRTVDIFCFRCHAETSTAMASKAHEGGGSASHRRGALACVDCHVPTVHGGKIAGLLTDRGAIKDLDGGVASGHTQMQEHQVFRWTEYQKRGSAAQSVNTAPSVSAQNVPKAMMYSISSARTYSNRRTCAVNSACHIQGLRAEQTASGWENWSDPD